MKIKVRRLNKHLPMPRVIDKGDWIDLYASCDYQMEAPLASRLTKNKTKRTVTIYDGMLPLGVAIEIPKGYEAILVPRSSTYKKYNVIQTNSIGIIDNSYSGDKDEWKLPIAALNDSLIKEGDRVCQFRIQLSQKATVWQKLKWLFSSKIELIEVKHLGNPNRGGFGEGTGV